MNRDDTLDLYMDEIAGEALLTPEEERVLGRAVQAGDARARQRMACANLRLVVSIARNYVGRGLPLADLIAEGNVGLLKAVDRFDPERGCRFSTFAIWWIRQSISRSLLSTVPRVRIPEYLVQRLQRFRSTRRELDRKLGRPTTE